MNPNNNIIFIGEVGMVQSNNPQPPPVGREWIYSEATKILIIII